MTAKESRVLNELINECWQNAETALKTGEEIESEQYLKAHLYLMKFNNEVRKTRRVHHED